MENVTKAVLIASAILIIINIVTLGVYITSYASQQDEQYSTTSQLEIMSNNSKYEIYEGIKKGSDVKKLLDLACERNEELYKKEDTIKYCVCIRTNVENILKKFSGNAEMKRGLNGTRYYGVRYPDNIKKISDCIENSRRYKIWFEYNEAGYIWEIHIDENK